MVAQQLFVLAGAELVVAVTTLAVLQPIPELEVAHELGPLVVELLVRVVGRLLLLDRPVADVLQAERARDHQHLGQRLSVAGFEDHATDARIERQARQFAADGRELVGLVHRTELRQQLVAVGDGALGRRLEEGKGLHLPEAQRLLIRRITPASDDRRISGSVKRGRAAKSFSS